jgi:succinate dehydrogenase / fumarate reductase membrane anchor subunit
MDEQDFRLPMAKVRGLGSAHEGTHHWIYQRLSAIALIFLGLWMLITLSQLHHATYEEWIVMLSSPWVASGVFLFLLATIYHACLGLQVVVEDYIHGPWLRYSLLTFIRLVGCFLVILALFFLIKIQLIGKI